MATEMNVFEKVFNNAKTRTGDNHLSLMIDEIDGVSVIAGVSKRFMEEGVVIRITSCNDLLDSDVRRGYTGLVLYHKDIDNADELEKFITQTLPTLKYRPELDLLLTDEELNDNEKAMMLNMMKMMPKNDTVKLYYECDECCVCMEQCSTKTQCKHSICRRCANNLKKNVCPMCRKNYDDDESEDESENESDEE